LNVTGNDQGLQQVMKIQINLFLWGSEVSRGMSIKKRIRKQKAEKVLARLGEIPNPKHSIRQFDSMNFDTLQRSEKSLKSDL
jgi:hypothetical protein